MILCLQTDSFSLVLTSTLVNMHGQRTLINIKVVFNAINKRSAMKMFAKTIL